MRIYSDLFQQYFIHKILMSVVLGHNDCRWALAKTDYTWAIFHNSNKNVRTCMKIENKYFKNTYNFKKVIFFKKSFYQRLMIIYLFRFGCCLLLLILRLILYLEHIKLLMIKKCWYNERFLLFSFNSIHLIFMENSYGTVIKTTKCYAITDDLLEVFH